MKNNIITIFDTNYDQATVFNGGMASILEQIRQEATATIFDVTTAEGRQGLRTMAHKVAKSKVVLDNHGKALVKDWKDRAKLVDGERKALRDTLDELRDEIRAPLTKWEADEEAKEEAQALADQIEANHTEALQIHDLFTREAEIARKEAAFAAAQAAQDAADEAKKAEEARVAEQDRLIEEARLQARQEVEQGIKDREAEARRVGEKLVAIAEAKAAKAEKEAAQAIENANIEAERKLQAEREAEKQRQREALAAAQTKENRREINRAARQVFEVAGISRADAEMVVQLIATGKVPGVSISYMGVQ